MSFKSISQKSIKIDKDSSYVVLPAPIAKEVVKDLERYKIVAEVSKEQEKRLNLLQEQNVEYKRLTAVQDTIIRKQKEHISLQDELLGRKKKIAFRAAVGVQALYVPQLYGTVEARIDKFTVAARYYTTGTDQMKFGFNIEYDIFNIR